MKSYEIMGQAETNSAKIARQIVNGAVKAYVPEDWEAAVDKAIFRFAQQMKEAAKAELRFQRMRKIPPKTGI